jgi:hypothetical protein
LSICENLCEIARAAPRDWFAGDGDPARAGISSFEWGGQGSGESLIASRRTRTFFPAADGFADFAAQQLECSAAGSKKKTWNSIAGLVQPRDVFVAILG